MQYGKIVVVSVTGVKIGGGSWDTGICPYTIPAGSRPPSEISSIVSVPNSTVSRRMYVDTGGKIKLQNMGGAGSNQGTFGSVTYIIA